MTYASGRPERGAGFRVAVAAALAAIVPLRVAASAEVGNPPTLTRLLDVARSDNAEIRAAEARYRAMQQRPIQEGTLPDPMVGVRYHNERSDRITLGESEFSFVELFAEQEIPFPGKLGRRAEMASREAEREGAMRDATVLMVLAKVAVGLAGLTVVDRSTEILHESVEALGLMVEQSAASYRVGAAAQQDILRATLERDALQERLIMLAQKRAAAAATMNHLLNRSRGEPFPPVGWSDAVPTLAPLATLSEEIAKQAPELRAAREDVLKADAALGLARREYLPDFAFMTAYTNKNGLFPEWEVGMRLKVPLYFWRRQRAGVAEATFAKQSAEHTQQHVELTLEERLRELYSMAGAAQRLVRLYADSLVPQATLTLQSARSSYAVGKVDFLTTLNAFTALLDYRIRYAEELGNLFRARAEIGPLVGRGPLDWDEDVR
jgi:outer membrane protein, heavy metal efflux system